MINGGGLNDMYLINKYNIFIIYYHRLFPARLISQFIITTQYCINMQLRLPQNYAWKIAKAMKVAIIFFPILNTEAKQREVASSKIEKGNKILNTAINPAEKEICEVMSKKLK
jgi:hypothetical protein